MSTEGNNSNGDKGSNADKLKAKESREKAKERKFRASNKQAEKRQIEEHLRTVDDDIRETLSQGKLKDKKARQRKLVIRIISTIAGGLFLWWAYIALFTYGKSSMAYGVCKVFLEQQVEYPLELRYSSVQDFAQMVRIWYVQHDSFGSTRFEMIDCYFKKDGSGLDKVEINRRQLENSLIESFNKSIPAIMAYPPDLTYPPGLPSNIKALKRD